MEKTVQKTINVGTAFTLIINTPGKQPRTLHIPTGVQKVDEDIAEHWYTKIHLANGGLGTVEYAKATRASADAAFVKAKAMVDEYDGLEQAAQEAEEEAGLDRVAPSHQRLSGPTADPEEEEFEIVEDDGDSGDDGEPDTEAKDEDADDDADKTDNGDPEKETPPPPPPAEPEAAKAQAPARKPRAKK